MSVRNAGGHRPGWDQRTVQYDRHSHPDAGNISGTVITGLLTAYDECTGEYQRTATDNAGAADGHRPVGSDGNMWTDYLAAAITVLWGQFSAADVLTGVIYTATLG